MQAAATVAVLMAASNLARRLATNTKTGLELVLAFEHPLNYHSVLQSTVLCSTLHALAETAGPTRQMPLENEAAGIIPSI